MINIISKPNNSFANDLIQVSNKQIQILDYQRVQFAPKWLKLFLSQKELCLSKNYLIIQNNSSKEMSKTYFSFEPLDCLGKDDIYYIDSLISNKEFGLFQWYKKIRQKSIVHSLSNSSKIFTSSNALKNHILNEFKPIIPNLSIEVVYPSIIQKKIDYKKIKTKFTQKYEIDFDSKFVLFIGDDFLNDGGKEFINIFDELSSKNTKAIFVAPKSQIEGFRFMARKLKSYDNIIFIDDKYDEFSIEEIMRISDIYLHPTYRKKFDRNTIKAMYYQNAVFLSHKNFASELVDTFSLIENPTDLGIVHKIEALLQDIDSLKQIQEENKDKVKHLDIKKLNILN